MGITAEGMKARYMAAISSVGQTSDPAAAAAASDAVILALFAAVVDEIHANASATGADSSGDTHTLVIE